MDNPRVSVIMPVLNGEKYLEKAIDSILYQTMDDFEFIIISEYGNSEACGNILMRYASTDNRVKVVRNETRKTLPESLNIGISLSKGKYIARMDADDVSLPERFAIQTAFLDENPQVSICTTTVTMINEKGDKLNRCDCFSSNSEQIYSDLLFYCYLHHPTVMMRRSEIIRYNLLYNNDFLAAEDYEFFNRAAKAVKIQCIPEVLLLYRLHAENVSRIRKELCIENFILIMRDNFLQLGMEFSNEELRILCPLTCKISLQNCFSYCRFINKVLNDIFEKNKELKLYDDLCLLNTVKRRAFWRRAPWRLMISATLRSIGSVSGFFSKRTSSAFYSAAFCVETYGVRAIIRIMKEYISGKNRLYQNN